MDKLRVIQWTTGKVGKLALRGIMDDPRLELAGVYCWSDDKRGTDAGDLCGRPACGVVATNDIEALIATGADIASYNPFLADLDHITRLLAAGLDVVSTNLLLNLGGVRGEVEQAIAAACAEGKSSFYVSGVNPGWINSLVALLTAVCRDVKCVTISEAADCSVYESEETWLAMGISLPEVTDQVHDTARMWLTSFRDAVERIARALQFDFDDIDFFLEYAKASEDVDLGFMKIGQGTHGAVRGGWRAKIADRTVIELKVSWFLTERLVEGWELVKDQYELRIDGEPSIDTRIRFIPPEHWGNHEWDTMTAMPPINALLDVRAAPAGILTLKEVGLTSAPAGLWLQARS